MKKTACFFPVFFPVVSCLDFLDIFRHCGVPFLYFGSSCGHTRAVPTHQSCLFSFEIHIHVMTPRAGVNRKSEVKSEVIKRTTVVKEMKTAAPTKARKLNPPLVTETALKVAQQAMKDLDELKRQRSSCICYLRSLGKDKEYASWPIAERNWFLERYAADRIASGKAKSLETKRAIRTGTYGKREFEWLCKKEMIDRFGDVKGLKKIAKLELLKTGKFDGMPTHRPDDDTGDDGEWDREYRIYNDTGGRDERDENESALCAEKNIDSAEQLAEHTAQLNDFGRSIMGSNPAETEKAAAGSASSSITVQPIVKLEPGSEQVAVDAMIDLDKHPFGTDETAMTDNQRVAHLMIQDAKKVLNNVGNALMTAKEIFKETKATVDDPKEFLQIVFGKMQTVIPQFAAMFKKVERVHLESITNPSELLALATKLNDLYVIYNKAAGFFESTGGKVGGKKPKCKHTLF